MYSKPSLAGELSRLLLAQHLGRGCAGPCVASKWLVCPEKHPLALGHRPQPPLLASPGAFPELWECWWDTGAQICSHQGCGFKKLISKTIWPLLVLFALSVFNCCPEIVSPSQGMEWLTVGTGRKCVQNLIQAFKTPGRKGVLEFCAKPRALSDATVWDHGNNRSCGVRGAESFQTHLKGRDSPGKQQQETPVNTHMS